jgi:hypothetical protein
MRTFPANRYSNFNGKRNFPGIAFIITPYAFEYLYDDKNPNIK